VGLDGLHFDVSKGFGSPGIQEWRFWWHHPGGKSLKFCQSKLTPALHMEEIIIIIIIITVYRMCITVMIKFKRICRFESGASS
jgi:hypothetical protein